MTPRQGQPGVASGRNDPQTRTTRSGSLTRHQGYVFQSQHQVDTVIVKSCREMKSLRMTSTKRRTQDEHCVPLTLSGKKILLKPHLVDGLTEAH
mgnify:CR=1 FL=1|jgi:hypothetical protein